MDKRRIDPVFRIHKTSQSGAEIFVYGIRMNSVGPIHYFENHIHARNFCRYLFSQTKAHPKNHLTQRNVVTQLMEPDMPAHNLVDPDQAYQAFMARHFPRHGADQVLCDDGAYLAFAVLTKSRHLISNVVSPDGTIALFDVGHMKRILATDQDIAHIGDMVRKAVNMVDFEGETTPSDLSLRTDKIVQRLVCERMGFDPVLSVSHRDQRDHNQCYHIHRLIRMVPPDSVEMAAFR